MSFVSTKFLQVSNVHQWFKILHIIVKTHCLSHKNANQALKMMLLSACNWKSIFTMFLLSFNLCYSGLNNLFTEPIA
jgi:hypothetical protein